MDWQGSLYDPVYDVLGVPATIAPGGDTGDVAVTAIDRTGGIEVAAPGGAIETVRAAATVRMAELAAAGLAREDLPDGTIALNGVTWTIKATMPRPSPKGGGDGELLLVLEEA